MEEESPTDGQTHRQPEAKKSCTCVAEEEEEAEPEAIPDVSRSYVKETNATDDLLSGS